MADRTYRGLRRSARPRLSGWRHRDSYWMTAEDFIEAGDETTPSYGPPGRSGGQRQVTEQPHDSGWTLRNGKALRVRYYDDRAEALEAAGLSE